MEGVLLKSQIAVDSKNMRRWPAVSLAANRRPSAIGCAKSLRVSIITIRGMRNDGVPWGTRCLSRFLNAR